MAKDKLWPHFSFVFFLTFEKLSGKKLSANSELIQKITKFFALIVGILTLGTRQTARVFSRQLLNLGSGKDFQLAFRESCRELIANARTRDIECNNLQA